MQGLILCIWSYLGVIRGLLGGLGSVGVLEGGSATAAINTKAHTVLASMNTRFHVGILSTLLFELS